MKKHISLESHVADSIFTISLFKMKFLGSDEAEVNPKDILTNKHSIATEGIFDGFKEYFKKVGENMEVGSFASKTDIRGSLNYIVKLKQQLDVFLKKLEAIKNDDVISVDISHLSSYFVDDKNNPATDISKAIATNQKDFLHVLSEFSSNAIRCSHAVKEIYKDLDLNSIGSFDRTFIQKIDPIKKSHWTRFNKSGISGYKQFLGGYGVGIHPNNERYDRYSGIDWLENFAKLHDSQEISPPLVGRATVRDIPGWSPKLKKSDLVVIIKTIQTRLDEMFDVYKTQLSSLMLDEELISREYNRLYGLIEESYCECNGEYVEVEEHDFIKSIRLCIWTPAVIQSIYNTACYQIAEKMMFTLIRTSQLVSRYVEQAVKNTPVKVSFETIDEIELPSLFDNTSTTDLNVAQEGFGDWVKGKWRDWLQNRTESNSNSLQTVGEIVSMLQDLSKKVDVLITDVKTSDKAKVDNVDISSVAGYLVKNSKVSTNIIGDIKSNFKNIQLHESVFTRLSKDGFGLMKNIYMGLNVSNDQQFKKTFIDRGADYKKYYWTQGIKPGSEGAIKFMADRSLILVKSKGGFEDKTGTQWFLSAIDEFWGEGLPLPRSINETEAKRPGETTSMTREEVLELANFVKDMIKYTIESFKTDYIELNKMNSTTFEYQVEGYKYQKGSSEFGVRYDNGLVETKDVLKKGLQMLPIIQTRSIGFSQAIMELKFTTTRQAFHVLNRIAANF